MGTDEPARPASKILRGVRGVRVCAAALALALGAGAPVAAQVVDNQTAVEGCVGCHAVGTAVPVADIHDPRDGHFIDVNADGLQTESGYRQLQVWLRNVDLRGSSVVIDFEVADENDARVVNIFAEDGRFNIAKLKTTFDFDPVTWSSVLFSERFTEGGVFENLGGGAYRYTSVFDPTSSIAAGETVRVAIQISAGDIPAGNGWCDFDADLSAPNGCSGPVSLTRDIVQTSTCNECHGVTPDVKLSFHGGRTEMEYCVTCHNPEIFNDGDTEMTRMVHKIHFGENLTMGWRDYGDVVFTKDVDNCLACHGDGSVDQDNWATVPSRDACGSCHDDVNFDTGENHGAGGQQEDNRFCANCHPAAGEWTLSQLPVSTVHQGQARAAEAALYQGSSNGYAVESTSWDAGARQLTVDFSVTRDGRKAVLQSDPEWTRGNVRLALTAGWITDEYTNDGSESMPAPAQPLSIDGLDVGGAVTDLQNGSYRTTFDIPDKVSDNLTVTIEGHPTADIRGNGTYVTIPVRSAYQPVNLERRGSVRPRRTVVDIDKCNACHDGSGAGLAFHGNNRTSEMQACVVCHNGNATDIRQRPSDPSMTPDGKREESIDMKRMIHQIHAGKDLQNGVVIYGFGNRPHDYSNVNFIGNNGNCESCHLPGTYSTDAAWATLNTTIDTGDDVTDPSDDLNISRISSTCSSCHDDDVARDHMLLNGGSFMAPDSHITLGAPEPGSVASILAAFSALVALRRSRARSWRGTGGGRG